MLFNYQQDPSKIGSIGKPAPNIEVKLLDSEKKIIQEPGNPGELMVRSKSCFSGYLYENNQVKKNLVDGWCSTNDLVYFDEEGYYWFYSRIDSIIQKAGEHISPSEIEKALLLHPEVSACVTVGIPDSAYNYVPVTWYATKHGQEIKKQELVDHLKKHIRAFFIPEIFHHQMIFPKLPNGKIDRKKFKKTAKNDIPNDFDARHAFMPCF